MDALQVDGDPERDYAAVLVSCQVRVEHLANEEMTHDPAAR